MSNFNEGQFEKKLQLLKDSQESIQQLSTWCLQHRSHHKKIVATWLRILKKVKIEHRLTLFYLANDVIQYSKRKNYEFVESWGTALQRATTMVREEKVRHRILRIFKIWDERGIYDEAFIADLVGLITTTTKKAAPETIPDSTDFQPSALINKIRSCSKLEDDTDLKFKKMNESHLQLSDADALRINLKDRRQGDDVVAEVDEGMAKLSGYVKALEFEIKDRVELIELLEHAEGFYETQKGEAKIVVNAYRNFGTRVKNLKRRLDEVIPTLKDNSPVPSPPNMEDVPSPPPDSEDDMPAIADNAGIEVVEGIEGIEGMEGMDEQLYMNPYPPEVLQPIRPIIQEDQHSIDKCFSSFMGNSALPFDIQKSLFNDASGDVLLSPSPEPILEDPDGLPVLPGLSASEGKPIEVINSRSKGEEGFSITDFLKSLIPSRNNIPGLNIEAADSDPASPPHQKQLSYSEDPELLNPSNNDYDYPLSSSPSPLEPPPLPPSLFPLDDSSAQYKYSGRSQEAEDAWNTKLPPKFPTWGDTSSGWDVDGGEKVSEWMPVMPVNKLPIHELETPESPPNYEKEGFSDPVEYDDSVDPGLLSSAADVDHRTLVALPLANHNAVEESLPPEEHREDTDIRMLMPIPPANPIKKDIDHRPLMHRKKDVDHRNLISLTGSPLRESHSRPLIPPPTPPNLSWPRGDQDYRGRVPPMLEQDLADTDMDIVAEEDVDYRLPLPRKHLDETQDNVESVDMEMSDDEIMEPPSMVNNVLIKRDPPPLPPPPPPKNIQLDISPVKPVISFNINSQKILTSSPLNEVKEDLSKPRNKMYGCQKIPTIGGRIQSPRPRNPLFSTPPPTIVRLNVPPPPRNFRPALLLTPPPPPPQLMPHETFNTPVRIKPMAELINRSQETVKVQEPVVLEPETPVEEEIVIVTPPEQTPPVKELPKEVVDEKQWNDDSDSDSVQDIETTNDSVTENTKKTDAQWTSNQMPVMNNSTSNEAELEAEKIVVEVNISQKQEPVVEKWINSTNDSNAPWMNDDIPEFENQPVERIQSFQFDPQPVERINSFQFDPQPVERINSFEFEPQSVERINSFDRGRNHRGRGHPFMKNFPPPPPPPPPPPRGAFGPGPGPGPRQRPNWSGPRRGGGPPPRFPFRPPHDGFARGQRGGFRPFRGNPRHFGGW